MAKKLCSFYKIKIDRIPCYLAELNLFDSHSYNIGNTKNIRTYLCRADAPNYFFFLWLINEWNKHNSNIQTSSFIICRDNFIKIIRSIPNIICGTFNPLIIKLITRIKLELNRLDECKFNNTFNNCTNPLCKGSLDPYTAV